MSRRSDVPGGGQHAERDGQIERRSGLADVGRREIHRDAVGRELEAGIPDRASHAVAALADARVRQSHHLKCGQAKRDIHLHLDETGLDPEYRGGPHAGKHPGG